MGFLPEQKEEEGIPGKDKKRPEVGKTQNR
jgi:hypothetical protein